MCVRVAGHVFERTCMRESAGRVWGWGVYALCFMLMRVPQADTPALAAAVQDPQRNPAAVGHNYVGHNNIGHN